MHSCRILLRNAAYRIKADWKRYAGGLLATAMVCGILILVCGGVCPISRIWGFPCPGCGLTRSILLLLIGRWQQSWQMQPFGMIWVVFLLAAGVERYLIGRNGLWKKVVLIFLLAAMLGFYVWKMGTVFPKEAPYTYQEGNLTEKLLPGYEKWIQQLVDE